jgi:predicted amidohydrolase YtcJ
MGKAILFENAIIHTGRTQDETAASMLVKDGRILSLDPKSPGNAQRVSLGGKHVYPCLIDGHIHLLYSVVMAGQGVDVCTVGEGGVVPNSMAGVERELRAFAAGKPKNGVLVGNNYILSGIDQRRLPSREELDEWMGGRPVVIYTIDGHASALSTAMLQKMGIDPRGHSGVLMGEAHDRVQGKLTDIIAGGVTPSVLARGVARFHNACARYGISCVGALEGNGDSPKDPTTALIVKLARHFDVDVRLYLQYMDIDKARPYRKMQKTPRIGGCGDWEMDGAVGAHSAAFSLPFRDTGLCAGPYYEQDFVDERVRYADEQGYQVASHAIGNMAVKRIVKALSTTASGRMHRIEHCEWADAEDVDIIAKHHWAVMMQPGYAWIDKRYLHTYEQFLSDDMRSMLQFKTLCDKGICVCGSSDSPVQTLDPWQQMLGMTQFYREEESVSPYEAFRCYTINPARALQEEDERGLLEVGKKADFFTTDQNIFTMTPQQLGAVRPHQTYYGGKAARVWKGTVPELLCLFLRPGKRL